MQHDIPDLVTLNEARFLLAGFLLGGSKLYSKKTIQRLILARRLEAIGEHQERRVVGLSLRALIAELAVGKPLWPESGSQKRKRSRIEVTIEKRSR